MDANSDDGLYAVFIEATNGGGAREQWMYFPPAFAERAVEFYPGGVTMGAGVKPGTTRFIKRRLNKVGDKARWATTEREPAPGRESAGEQLKLELAQYVSTGWTFMPPIVIKLDKDDYEGKVWGNNESVSTPYKALRAVERVSLKQWGRRLI